MFTKRHNSRAESLNVGTPRQTRLNMSKGYVDRRARAYETWGDFDHVFNAITDPIIIFDTEFNIVRINKAAKHFFIGRPIGKKCFFTKHKFALACKNCPTWQTMRSGIPSTSEILSPITGTLLLIKTYPIYSRVKKVKGVVLIGRESTDVHVKWKEKKIDVERAL